MLGLRKTQCRVGENPTSLPLMGGGFYYFLPLPTYCSEFNESGKLKGVCCGN